MINLDLSLLDQDKKRKERRRHLFRVYAMPIIILFAISFFFLSTWIYNLAYLISYTNKNYPIAHGVTETRYLINVLEPYIASYNQGNAHMLTGEFKKAEDRYTDSLRNNPPDNKICTISENLSLSIEKQADEKLGLEMFSEAIILYSKAEAVLYTQGCAGINDEQGKSYTADVARDRIIGKRESAINARNKSVDDDDSSDDGPREKDITEEDLKKNKENRVSPNTKALGMQFIEKLINGATYECKVNEGDYCW